MLGECSFPGRFFCLLATESTELCSLSESTLILTKAEAPTVQKGHGGRGNSVIQVNDSYVSLKDTTKMALPAPECCQEFGNCGDVVNVGNGQEALESPGKQKEELSTALENTFINSQQKIRFSIRKENHHQLPMPGHNFK